MININNIIETGYCVLDADRLEVLGSNLVKVPYVEGLEAANKDDLYDYMVHNASPIYVDDGE